MMRLDDELLTTAEAALLTKMSASWYEHKRVDVHADQPPYHRRGRSIRYLKSELLGWWATHAELT